MVDYPKISVVTITYAHEHYIMQTLDSVLLQIYPGEIEFIIANDNSPDSTDKVIRDYLSINKIPNNFTIKYTKHDINKGMIPNFIWALEQVTGKYIALCEGDDYWTDPDKLQKQVDFLEANEDYVLSFTNRDILKNDVIEESEILYDKVSFHKSEIPYKYVPTLTAVFRNVVKHIPTQMHSTLIDSSLFLFLSQFGSFYYFNKSMAVYRIHDQGINSGSSDLINYTRSTKARLAAWILLKDVDRLSLAHVLQYWIKLKKESERKNKKYFLALQSSCLDAFFDLYVLHQIFKAKIKKLKISFQTVFLKQ